MHHPIRTFALIPALLFFTLFTACNPRTDALYTDFESTGSLPPQWAVVNESGAYSVRIDSTIAHQGKRSLVLERSGKTEGGMASVLTFTEIPVDFSGETIEVSAYIKTENVESGFCGLYLKVEGDPAWSQTNAMREADMKGTAGWKQYTLTMPLQKGAREICLGAYLTGSGKLWIDDLALRADGKPLAAAPRIRLLPARQDTAFRNGTGIALDTLTPAMSDNLARLAKVWGFLKYYHPAVAAGQYNWDAELFRVLPAVLRSTGREDANAVMAAWVERLQPGAPGDADKKEPLMVRQEADLGWLEDTVMLGNVLSRRLQAIRKLPRSDQHYYVEPRSAGHAPFTNESRYAQASPADGGYRLLALFRYWNYVQYYFPYKHLIGEDWHGVLARFVPVFAAAKDAESYQLAVLRLVTAINDSHGLLEGNIVAKERYFGMHRIPADVRYVEGRPTVVRAPAGIQGDALERGDALLKVNGMPVGKIRERLDPYVPASNENFRAFMAATHLLRGADSLFTLEVERNGQVKPLRLVAGMAALRHPGNQPTLPEKPWSLLPGNIGYIYLGTLRKADIPEMMKQIFATKGMIIDLRCYPSDMCYAEICSYLSPRAVPFLRTYIASVREPGQFSFKQVGPVGSNNRYAYRGKVIVLVDENTQSRGEFFAMAFKAMPNVTILGGPTAGTDGTAADFYLPGGLKTRFTGEGICWPDNTESQRTGIVPDVPVRQTRKGVAGGKDEVLAAALQRLQP